MKKLQIINTSDKVVQFMHQDGWDVKQIAKDVDMSPQTFSRRIKLNDWLFDEIRALKRLFARRGYEW